MPGWAQVVVGIAAVVTALGVLWSKVLKPGAKLISTTEEMLPLLRNLTATFRSTPDAFQILSDIAAQFRTNSGSSLRDLLDRVETTTNETRRLLEQAAAELHQTDEALRVGVETTKQLAAIDRESQRQLMLEVNRLSVQLADLTAADIAGKAKIAAALKEREHSVDTDLESRRGKLDTGTTGIASDLASDKRRADAAEAAPDSAPGAAADAAALTPTAAERREERRRAEEARRAKWDREEQENDEAETGEPATGEAPSPTGGAPAQTDDSPTTGDTPTGGGEG